MALNISTPVSDASNLVKPGSNRVNNCEVTASPNANAIEIHQTSDDGQKSYHVPVIFQNPADVSESSTLFENPFLWTWVQNLSFGTLKQITIKYIMYSKDKSKIIGCLIDPVIEVQGVVKTFDYPVILHESPTVGVLVILRFIGDGLRNRDYVLFNVDKRNHVKYERNLALFLGRFSSSNEFECSSWPETSVLPRTVHNTDLVLLSREAGIITSQDPMNDPLWLYLYRQNISADDYTAIVASAEKGHIKIVPIGEAWHDTSDAQAMSALMLFHEFRYHKMMPRYKSPSVAVATSPLESKRKPEFMTIDSLDPNCDRPNLRVKTVCVVEAAETKRSIGAKEVIMKVGDATGVINLRLSAAQIKNAGITDPDTCWILQNACLDVVNNHLLLSVDMWGILNPAKPDELSCFQFEPGVSNDKSAVEYERVRVSDDVDQPPRNPDRWPRSTGSRRGRGRGYRGRSRDNAPQ